MAYSRDYPDSPGGPQIEQPAVLGVQTQQVPPKKKRRRKLTFREMALAGIQTPGQVFARPPQNGNMSALGGKES